MKKRFSEEIFSKWRKFQVTYLELNSSGFFELYTSSHFLIDLGILSASLKNTLNSRIFYVFLSVIIIITKIVLTCICIIITCLALTNDLRQAKYVMFCCSTKLNKKQFLTKKYISKQSSSRDNWLWLLERFCHILSISIFRSLYLLRFFKKPL